MSLLAYGLLAIGAFVLIVQITTPQYGPSQLGPDALGFAILAAMILPLGVRAFWQPLDDQDKDNKQLVEKIKNAIVPLLPDQDAVVWGGSEVDELREDVARLSQQLGDLQRTVDRLQPPAAKE